MQENQQDKRKSILALVESREKFALCAKSVSRITRIRPKVGTARDWEKDKAVVDLSGSRRSQLVLVVTGFYS